MPKEKGDKMAITVWIDKGVVEKMDILADKGGLTRSKLLANLITVDVDELWGLKKFGFWAFARILEDIRQRNKKRYEKLIDMEKSKLLS